MLCECWLGIASDISLFWYNKVVYFRIELPLHRNHHLEYIDAIFKSFWRVSSSRWFLVDMHIQPQWANRHLLPPLINKKRGEPPMTPRLVALVKWVAKLHDTDLRACHKLEHECSRQADLSREPPDDKIFNPAFYW
jgi:hypothetical protein